MLQLRDIRKSFDGTVALHIDDLEVSEGRTTVLIGPSGCGKSTLLRLMIGLLTPDSGAVRIYGNIVTRENASEIRRKVGYVIQEGGLFPHLTVRANVTLMALHLNWPRERIDHRLAELIELTHFPAAALDRYPAQISGGQQQRVALMRALMLDPGLILLDEPLGSLDPMIRAELQVELRAIFRALRKTVVLVTHDLGEAAYFGDEIVLLREGEIVQQGTIDEFLHSPAEPFVSRFIEAQRGPLDTLRSDPR